MSAGNLQVNLRPLRLAFLVDPNDRKAILESIQICSFLWGGSFNPIVPVFRRFSKREKFVYQGAERRNVVAGFIEAFDPDFIVPVGAVDIAGIDIGPREKIKATEILESVEDDGTPAYGIGLFEILQEFIPKELKFVRRKPLPVQIPAIANGPDALFFAAVFGQLSPKIESNLILQLRGVPEVKRDPVSLANYADMLHKSHLFIRRLSASQITPKRHWHMRGDCVLYLDSTNRADILDYWNLRAVGWNVFPVSAKAASQDNLRKFVEEFVNDNAYPLRANRNIYNTTTFLPSGSQAMTDAERFGRSLHLQPSKHQYDSKISYQWWFPRIWDEWARDKDAASPCEFDVATEEHEISSDDSISFKGIMPSFAFRFGGHTKPRCANDLRLRLWSQREVFAEVIPEGDQRIASAAGAVGWKEWRCSRKGLVHLPVHKNWRARLNLPIAGRVFEAWLKGKGWESELSDKGHIARQIVKQMGGYFGLNLLALPRVVALLDQISREKVLRAGALRQRLIDVAKTDEYHLLDVNQLLGRLVEQRVIQLGLFLQCPTCRQRSWYSITDADYALNCPKCLESFNFPASSQVRWGYRTLGPFSLPDYAYGAYAVLLTFRFFSRLLDAATTPMFSFTATNGAKRIEVDLGLFVERMHFGTPETELAFVECKTYSAFDRRDVNRMTELAHHFPGALLVFATLKTSLDEKERKLLRPLVNKGRRYWKTDRPYNPVLILTGNELLTDRSPRRQWEELGGDFARHSQSWGDQRALVSLADATQQIYLGLQPWHTWLEERHKRRRRPVGNQTKNDAPDGLETSTGR